MVIGFDGSRAFLKERTGTENYSYQLLKHLAKIDHKNSYIVYLRPHVIPAKAGIQLNDGSRIKSGMTNQGDDDYKWPSNFTFETIKWPRLWTQAGLAARTFQDPLDVLFIPAHTSPLIHKPGLKTVVTVHDLGAEYLPKAHQIKQQLYLKYITKYQIKHATKIIAVSKATKEDLIKKAGVKAKNIQVIYEGYNQELFKPTKSDVLVSSLRPYYLFVGTVQPRKNLERLILAYHKLLSEHKSANGQVSSISYIVSGKKIRNTKYEIQNTNLVIAGSKGWLSEDIYELPKKLGIEERVKFLGHLPDEKLPALYSGAISLVFPSLFEGFGLPILEAQACGTPVITSNTSSMPEVAGKGAILVDPYSVEDIANAMIRVREKDVRSKLVDLGYKNIKRFSWEKCARETLKVLEEL